MNLTKIAQFLPKPVRRILKKCPGVTPLVHWVFRSKPGLWLYHRDRLGWLLDPKMNRQFPWPYRAFAVFCILQTKYLRREKIVAGAQALRIAMFLSKLTRQPASVCLTTGEYSLFVNLRDPRLLQIPSEIERDTAVLKHLLAPGDTFVDVGANHGTFSLVAARIMGSAGLVIAIEPQQELAQIVEMTLSHFATCPFQVACFACGEHNGNVQFYIPKGSSGVAGVYPLQSARGSHESVVLEMKRFEDAFDWKRFPGNVVLKLDVEGCELAFLQGAGQMIRERRPKLLIEINPISMKIAQVSAEAFLSTCLALGYRRFLEVDEPSRTRPLEAIDLSRVRNVVLLF